MGKKLATTALAAVLALGICPTVALADDGALAIGSIERLSMQDDAAYTAELTFSDDGISAASGGSGYKVSGTALTINAAGTYRITGSCEDGSIKVKKGTTGVTLVLDDLKLSCSTTAPLVINKNTGDVTVEIEGSVVLTDAESLDNEYNADGTENDDFEGAAIKFKGTTLTLTGAGTLSVDGNCKNGIKGGEGSSVVIGASASDALAVNVTASNNGIASDGSVVVNGGTVNVNAANDGVKASPDADDSTSAGTITVNGGNLSIVAGDKGFNANTGDPVVTIDDSGTEATVSNTTAKSTIDFKGGVVSVVATGDAIHASGDITASAGAFDLTSTEGDGIHSKTNVAISGGTFNILTKGGYQTNHNTVDSLTDGEGTSYKGIKASADDEDADAVTNAVTITGGSFRLNTLDDAVHSDDVATITGGTLRIWTGDDGVHADTSLTLGSEDSTSTTSPAVFVNYSYEGLEGGSVYVYSGKYRVYASDDGINAADGSGTGDAFNPGGQPTQPGGNGGNFGPGSGNGGNNGGMRSFSEEESADQTADLDTQAAATGNYKLEIHGGDVFVNTGSDGLDSNGALTLDGGSIVVWGAAAGSDGGPFDCDGTFTVNGATVFAAGSGQMDAHTSTGSSQKCVVSSSGSTMGGGMGGMFGGGTNASGATFTAGQLINVTDGSTVVTTPALKAANYVFYSSPTLSSSATLSAASAASQHTITYNSNGHGTAPASQTVYDGSYIFEPAPLTAEGWAFGGWYTDEACTKAFAFGDVITSDQTLYAKWTAVSTEAASPEDVIPTNVEQDKADADSNETAGTLSGNSSNSGSNSSNSGSNNSNSNTSTTLSNEEAAAMFSDVTPSHWVASEGWLAYVVENKLMTGYSNTDLFGPDDPIQRGQVATILYRYAHPDSTATTTNAAAQVNTTKFTDLKNGMYYTEAINWANEVGIMTGDANTGYTTVRAEDGITRQELAAMLYRFASLYSADLSGNTAASFATAPDASAVSSWATEAMGWCYAHGVMTGDATTGYLNPGNGATRAHMAKMVTVVVKSLA